MNDGKFCQRWEKSCHKCWKILSMSRKCCVIYDRQFCQWWWWICHLLENSVYWPESICQMAENSGKWGEHLSQMLEKSVISEEMCHKLQKILSLMWMDLLYLLKNSVNWGRGVVINSGNMVETHYFINHEEFLQWQLSVVSWIMENPFYFGQTFIH